MRKLFFFHLLGLAYSLPALSDVLLPPLPEAVTNNAVASVTVGEDTFFVSFMGLGAGKQHKDVHNMVWALRLGDSTWSRKSPVPSSLPLSGRLASVAVGVDDKVFLFGGYTVAEDHSEISSPDSFRYDIATDTYQRIAAMPVPVDDSVALNFNDESVYLISGWHNDGNVNLVQRYDIGKDAWTQASPFLGAPVFGHAAAIIGNQLVVCDGVAVVPLPQARRTFAPKTACYHGAIDSENPDRIEWRTLTHPTGEGRYRMAAGSDPRKNELLFFGGSANPYNYNGLGYNGEPSQPTNALWRFDLNAKTWQLEVTKSSTMDHRGLLSYQGHFYVLGGMAKDQQVSAGVTRVK